MLEATSGFLATRAIAGDGQNRPADCLQFHLAASAYLGEVFLLFLVHCDRPFVGPVYEVILALVRNIRNGLLAAAARVSWDVRFAPTSDTKVKRRRIRRGHKTLLTTARRSAWAEAADVRVARGSRQSKPFYPCQPRSSPSLAQILDALLRTRAAHSADQYRTALLCKGFPKRHRPCFAGYDA